MVLFSEGIDYPTHDIFAAHDATTVLGAMQDAVAAADLFSIGARDPRSGMGDGHQRYF